MPQNLQGIHGCDDLIVPVGEGGKILHWTGEDYEPTTMPSPTKCTCAPSMSRMPAPPGRSAGACWRSGWHAPRHSEDTMKVLPWDMRCRIVGALADGNSIRATGRLCGICRNTVMYYGRAVGEGCSRLHDFLMRDLQVNVLEFDEIWAYIFKKEKRVKPDDDPDFGDNYTFLALDATRKAIISYVVGKRTGPSTDAFALDVRKRIVNRPQISTDGFQPYLTAIYAAFGMNCDYAQIIKQYGSLEGDEHRYSPPKCTGAQRIPIIGEPVRALISTSYVERQNLTVMSARRFTRLTNAFSKKLRTHAAAVGLYVAHYNLVRVHETLKTTPAAAMGVTDHPWSVAELIDSALSIAPPPEPPNVTIALLPPVDRQLDLFDRPAMPELPPGFQLSMFHDS